jgi:hypothetical protein
MLKKTIIAITSFSMLLFALPTVYPMNVVEPMNAVEPISPIYPIDIYDLDDDGDVDIQDIMKVASAWNSTVGNDKYNSDYDFNRDNIIDIQDIMLVSSRWNKIVYMPSYEAIKSMIKRNAG